jgi:hypothetical protein
MIDLLELQTFAKTFPNAQFSFKRVVVDGSELPFDATKVPRATSRVRAIIASSSTTLMEPPG